MRSDAVLPSIPGMWRWRPNPLRRHSDVVEAWAGLTAAVLTAVAAPAAGLAAGHAVSSALHQAVVTQRAQRHEVTATVLATARPHSPLGDPDDTDEQATDHTSRVGWKGTDGTEHSAAVNIVGKHPPGTRLPVWVDHHGQIVEPPLDEATATTNAVAAGFGAAAGVAALVMSARHILSWRILRRRLADWERDWARVGQDWGRAGAGG